jgi:hypothetical protein
MFHVWGAMNPPGSSMCKVPKLVLPPGFAAWPARDQRLYTMRARWLSNARPEQLLPEGDWRTWLLLSGRGFGKTTAPRTEPEPGVSLETARGGPRR